MASAAQFPFHLVRWRRCSFRRMPSSQASRRSSLFDPADLDWRWDPVLRELDRDIALHLAEVKAYKSGMVELRTRCKEIAASHRMPPNQARQPSPARMCSFVQLIRPASSINRAAAPRPMSERKKDAGDDLVFVRRFTISFQHEHS